MKSPQKRIFDINPPSVQRRSERAKAVHEVVTEQKTTEAVPERIVPAELTPLLVEIPAEAKPTPTQTHHQKPYLLVRRSRAPYYVRLACIAILIGIGAFVGVSGIGFVKMRSTLAESAPKLIAEFQDAREALTRLETAKAQTSLTDINSRLTMLASGADQYGFAQLASVWSTLVPQLRRASDAFTQLITLSETALDATGKLGEIQEHGVQWLMQREGKQLIERVDQLRAHLTTVSRTSEELEKNIPSNVSGIDLLDLDSTLYKTTRFLDAFAAWLKTPHDHHVLVMFENSSELRPAGGFLGSYAIVTFDTEGVKGISVEDIYDTDGQLDRKIAAPKALRPITDHMGARDANWFFDFPTSAAKVIELIEGSKIYRERSQVFDGAIAITADVVERLFDLTGPIELPEYDITLTGDNFLAEVQREIETGYDNRVLNEPKLILKRAAPILIERLAHLSAADRTALLNQLHEEIVNRNIMVYFKDIDLQTYFADMNAAGEVLSIPAGTAGEYLAVVSANVGGGKSDAFIDQRLKLVTSIAADGSVDNYLHIERSHTGQNKKDPWYRAPNRSYLQIYTPKDSHLDFVDGFNAKVPVGTLNPIPKNFERDVDIETIERSAIPVPGNSVEQLQAFGKTVFAGWVTVLAGEQETLELRYTNPQRVPLSNTEIPYHIIIERQPGAPTSLDLLAEAPTGYVWKESGTNLFNYVTENLPGRVVLALTLVPNQVVTGN